MLIKRLNKDWNWLLHLFIYTCGTCSGGMPNWHLLKDINIKKENNEKISYINKLVFIQFAIHTQTHRQINKQVLPGFS